MQGKFQLQVMDGRRGTYVGHLVQEVSWGLVASFALRLMCGDWSGRPSRARGTFEGILGKEPKD
jgi:hypothetical protein